MPRRTTSIAHELRTIRTSFRQLARAFDRIGLFFGDDRGRLDKSADGFRVSSAHLPSVTHQILGSDAPLLTPAFE